MCPKAAPQIDAVQRTEQSEFFDRMSKAVVDADGARQMARMKNPLMLPPACVS